jgi:type IV pilus assembly protein PilM
MGFSMFSAQVTPIAIDFGASVLKLMQVSMGDRPMVQAAASVEVPDAASRDPEQLMQFYAQELPRIVRAGDFKGKRAVCAVPSGQTFIQHMQVPLMEGVDLEEAIKSQLQVQMGCSPRSIVVRTIEVADVHRDGRAAKEVICFAASREVVMRYVDLLKRCKLDPVGVHTETMAMVRSFDHLNRRDEDANVTTLYADMGWSGTRLALAHGKNIRFARYIQVGGRHFDQTIAQALNCDVLTARERRLKLGTPNQAIPSGIESESELPDGMAVFKSAMLQAAAEAPQETGASTTIVERRSGQVPAELRHTVDLSAKETLDLDLGELLEIMTDEVAMCLRYHKTLFPERGLDRVIFLGGEARQGWLCRHIARTLHLNAQMGDPMARLQRDDSIETPGVSLTEPQPGWAVPCGLCIAPTDL